uniref:Protein TsetseEP domain-containing protein n=1 Tax=Megaselia scalaris TaxID=36166 RepID=T1GWI1_MEGSC
MNSLVIACVLGLFAAPILAAPMAKLPNNLYYIVNLTVAENDARIDYYDAQLILNNKLIANTLRIDGTNVTNRPFLNFTSPNCVIEYGRLPELSMFQGSINDCIRIASKAGDGLFSSVTNSLKQARKENDYMKRTINTCTINYTGYNLTICVNDNLQIGKNKVWNLLYGADRGIEIALDKFDDIGRQAMECTFNVGDKLSREIEAVKYAVDQCK